MLQAILSRRSRRFGLGMEIPEGPTKFKSVKQPLPLTEIEEALLIIAGVGVSGFALADVPYQPPPPPAGSDRAERLRQFMGGGNAIISFVGRTYPTSAGSQGTELFYTNDKGVYVTNFRKASAGDIIEVARVDNIDEIVDYVKKHTTKLNEQRLIIPRRQPVISSVNLWDANQPGSTLFIPITDVSREYINLTFLYVGDMGLNIIDDLHGNKPCCGEKWLEKGLIRKTSSVPLSYIEKLFLQAMAVESGFIIQNMMLMAEALGVGGWVFSGMSPSVIMGGTPLSKGLGFRFVIGKLSSLPNPVGIDGVFQSYCPPYVKDMDEAVDLVLAEKFGSKGIYSSSRPTPFRKGINLENEVPRPSEDVIQCVKDICNYIYNTFGRFPATVDTMLCSLFFQAHHLDLEFYDKYYKEGAYTDTHRNHMNLWHS
ncbi:MAG: hypothetical protein QW158_07590 [Nitrososphaerales archaeon]